MAFLKVQRHADIVDRALLGFTEIIPRGQVDVFVAPSAFELPLVARDRARRDATARSSERAQARQPHLSHDFMAQAVRDGLTRTDCDSGVPALIGLAAPPQHHDHSDHHRGPFRAHLVEKGRQAARAALSIVAQCRRLAGSPQLSNLREVAR